MKYMKEFQVHMCVWVLCVTVGCMDSGCMCNRAGGKMFVECPRWRVGGSCTHVSLTAGRAGMLFHVAWEGEGYMWIQTACMVYPR